jgi:hypothetical protein
LKPHPHPMTSSSRSDEMQSTQGGSLPTLSTPLPLSEQKRPFEIALGSQEVGFRENPHITSAGSPVVRFRVSDDPKKEVANTKPRNETVYPRDVNASTIVWGGPSEECISISSYNSNLLVRIGIEVSDDEICTNNSGGKETPII